MHVRMQLTKEFYYHFGTGGIITQKAVPVQDDHYWPSESLLSEVSVMDID